MFHACKGGEVYAGFDVELKGSLFTVKNQEV